MFFRERCSLCDGKLDSHNICTECGLDNSKSERHYRINQSSCDGQPLTHVHSSESFSEAAPRKVQRMPEQSGRQYAQSWPASRKPRKKERTYNTYVEGEKRARSSRLVKVVVIVVIATAAVSIVPALAGIFSDREEPVYEAYEDSYGEEIYDDYGYDPYAYVTREIPAEGESYSHEFSQGDYIVGTHIPEGTYTVETTDGSYMSLSVDDYENGVYLYESLDEDTEKVEDIRLYAGASVSVLGDGYLTLSAQNAQTGSMEGQPNPLTETVDVAGGQTLTAGEDFPAGVYDITVVSGYGAPDVTVYDESGSEIGYLYPWISDSSEAERTYRNAVLPEGAVFANEDEDLELRLVPSETIASEDYLRYYT